MPETIKVKLDTKQNVAAIRTNAQQTALDRAAADAASYKKLNRFSEVEKRLLFAAFKEHQQIIDIKQRRNSYSSHKQAEVRACWERIVSDFNEHPETKNRTMRQVQKFWLNSKLRNQIPSVKHSPPTTPNSTFSSPRKSQTNIIKRTIRNDGTIVPMVADNNTSYTIQTEPDDPTTHLVKADPNELDDASQDMQDEEILDDDDEDVSNLIELKFIETVHQQHPDQTQQQPQQVTFHQGSMQIVHQQPDGGVQFSSMENMEVINDTADSHQHHLHSQQQPQQHHFTMKHNSSNASNGMDRRLFCGSDCGDADNAMSANAMDDHDQRSTNEHDPLHQVTDGQGNEIEVMSYSQQMNEIRLQDAQCRLKESQLRCELQQLAVSRAQEEMRQMREMHVLHITEMQLKLDKMKKELRMSMN